MVAVTGIMAAGKSTVAALLTERFERSAHVRGDLFRRMIVRGRAPITTALTPEDRRQLALRRELAAQTADAYARAGFVAVVQDIWLGSDLAALVRVLRFRPLHVVVLAPRPDAVARREAERRKSGYVDGWTAEAMDRILRLETPRLGLWLDTSDQTPQETASEVMRRLDEAAVP